MENPIIHLPSNKDTNRLTVRNKDSCLPSDYSTNLADPQSASMPILANVNDKQDKNVNKEARRRQDAAHDSPDPSACNIRPVCNYVPPSHRLHIPRLLSSPLKEASSSNGDITKQSALANGMVPNILSMTSDLSYLLSPSSKQPRKRKLSMDQSTSDGDKDATKFTIRIPNNRDKAASHNNPTAFSSYSIPPAVLPTLVKMKEENMLADDQSDHPANSIAYTTLANLDGETEAQKANASKLFDQYLDFTDPPSSPTTPTTTIPATTNVSTLLSGHSPTPSISKATNVDPVETVAIDFRPTITDHDAELSSASKPSRFIGRFSYAPTNLLSINASALPGSLLDVEVGLAYIYSTNKHRPIWGGEEGIYTADSDIASALLHANKDSLADATQNNHHYGLVLVHLEIVPSPTKFPSLCRNDIQSREWIGTALAIKILGWEYKQSFRPKRKQSPFAPPQLCNMSEGMIFSNLTMRAMIAYNPMFMVDCFDHFEAGRELLFEGGNCQYALKLVRTSRKKRIFELRLFDGSTSPASTEQDPDMILFKDLKWKELEWQPYSLLVRDQKFAIRAFIWV